LRQFTVKINMLYLIKKIVATGYKITIFLIKFNKLDLSKNESNEFLKS